MSTISQYIVENDGAIKCDENTSRLGITVFFGSIVMLFVTFVALFLSLKIKGMFSLQLSNGALVIAAVNTIILVLSSVVYFKGWKLFKNGFREKGVSYLPYSIITGVIFLIGQIFIWNSLTSSGLTAMTNVLVGIAYLIGGMHGLHIISGIFAQGWLLVKSNSASAIQFSLIGWFWHFLTILWIILFFTIVFIG